MFRGSGVYRDDCVYRTDFVCSVVVVSEKHCKIATA